MYQKLKKRTFGILEASTADLASRAFTLFIVTLISLNVIAVILETIEGLSASYLYFFRVFEIVSVVLFTIEYVLRVWSCTSDERFKGTITGRIRFVLTPMALVDLFAILPFYLPIIFRLDLRFIRTIRLFRLFRLFKVGRYSDSLKTFGNVLKAKKEQLYISVFVALILLVIASCLMYFAENQAQPEVFSSIPASMWWGIATLSTIGYGDIYPITVVGKIIGGIIAILGIAMFALPTGILSSGFVEVIQKRLEERRVCPHCGKYIDESPISR